MNNEILCGSSCVKYVLDYYKIQSNNINNKMKWITELAICLKNKGFKNISVLFYNSNLYNDYSKIKSTDLSFDGFKFIEQCIKQNILLIEKELTRKELLQEVKENKFIILCVESSKFNKENMVGGHFIILKGLNNDKIEIINPIKEKYEYKMETTENIIRFCENYGSWRILIKEDNND